MSKMSDILLIAFQEKDETLGYTKEKHVRVCTRGRAHTRTCFAQVDWPCHFISRSFILCDSIYSHVYLAYWFYHKVLFYFSFYRLVFYVHVYVLLYILYVLCFIVYFISCTLDKSEMTSIKTYILYVIAENLILWKRSPHSCKFTLKVFWLVEIQSWSRQWRYNYRFDNV